jgi:hypothetical protein
MVCWEMIRRGEGKGGLENRMEEEEEKESIV